MNSETPHKHENKEKVSSEIKAVLRDLPERYFTLMTTGSQLAKQGAFREAADHFAKARVEGSRVLRRLFELPKGSDAVMWQALAVLWAFKLVKSSFYWTLARSETAKTPEERKQMLLMASGAQLVGQDMLNAFETLDKVLLESERDLLHLFAEAIRNLEERQRFLIRSLKEQNIDLEHILGDQP